MDLFQKLYDENENINVRFVGFATEHARYDFGFVYTNLFFGKPLVICMQTGRSALLDPKDLDNPDYLQKVFRIRRKEEIPDLIEFFSDAVPEMPFNMEYE